MKFNICHWRGLALCTLIFLSGQVLATTNSYSLQQAKALSQSMSPAPLLERELINRKSNVGSVTLSPDGKTIAYLQREGKPKRKLASFWLYNITTKTAKKLFTFKDIRNYRWSKNSQKIFLQVSSGVAVSVLGKDPTPFKIVSYNPSLNEEWLGIDETQQESILVQLWDVETKSYVVYRMNADGEQQELFRNKNRFINFSLNADGTPSLIKEFNQEEDNKGERMIFDIASEKKRLLWTCQWDDPCSPFYFDRQNNKLLMKSNSGSDFIRLVWADLSDLKVKELHSDPNNFADLRIDLSQYSNIAGEFDPVIYSYHGDTLKSYGASESIQNHIDYIESKIDSQSLLFNISEYNNVLKNNWLVKDQSNHKRIPHYYLYDPNNKKLTRPLKEIITQANSNIKLMSPDEIAPTFPIHYKAKDGFELQGYVSFPRGVDLKTAPMVVKVHGGPWGRVYDDFESITQVLTNRGYIVFSPNFRASDGFGKAYKIGVKQDFGDGKVQQDIIDGVHYLLGNGIGDKSNIAISGHSFGGFSVLAGLAFTPELFQVGFAGAAPTDMGRSARFLYKYRKKSRGMRNDYFLKQTVVDWDNKKAFAENYAKSPDANADKITKPLVMWAGKNDRRVFIVDIKDYALKVEAMDKKISLFVDPDTLHSPSSKVGMEAYIYLMEKTLADHIGGKLQKLDKIKDKKIIRFLRKNMLIDHNGLTPAK